MAQAAIGLKLWGRRLLGSELNFEKINQVMMVAIEASSNFDDPIFESKLKALSQTDENLKIRNAAIKILEKTYNQVI